MDENREERRESHAQIARLEVQVERLEADVSELKADVKEVLAQLSEAKGSWKTLLAVAGFASSLGAVVAWIVGRFAK
jgi:phage shock protein A